MDKRRLKKSTPIMKQAILNIFYVDEYGKRHHENQGKFYYFQNNPVYLADMTLNKWWKNYGGYSISRQILDAFSKVKLRPWIIYRDKIKATVYITNMSTFKNKGILIAYGGYSQYVLPINRWSVKNVIMKGEPYNLPVLTVHKWIQTKKPDINEKPSGEDYEIVNGVARVKVKIGEMQQQSLI